MSGAPTTTLAVTSPPIVESATRLASTSSGAAHTNTIEGFFGHLKPSIRGTYRKVSHKWLQGYLNEFRSATTIATTERPMFETLLLRAASTDG